MKKLGLVLGGGGLKGLAHIGVLQVLAEHHIPVVSISGTSSGSIFAALLAAGMSPYEMESIAVSLHPHDYLDYNICGLLQYGMGLLLPGKNFVLEGLIKGKKLEAMIAYLTDYKRLSDIKMPLAIIACNINTGTEVIFSNQLYPTGEQEALFVQDALLSEAVRSSISIPGIFVPYNFQQMQLVDGGLKAVVPVTIQTSMGAEYIMTVNLGQESYQDHVDGMLQIISRTIEILVYETSDTAETLFADLIVNPRISEVHLDETKKAASIIRAGRRAMLAQLEELKRELQ